VAADFSLERALSVVSPPTFRGLAGAETVIVELDNSATYKLAGKARGDAIPTAIEAGHSRIEAAAARLFDMSAFLSGSVSGTKYIQLSALDLD
jgi:hypothetical protein